MDAQSSQPENRPRARLTTLGYDALPRDLLDWARKNGHLAVLHAVVCAAQASRESHIGIPLHFIARPTIFSLLDRWQGFDDLVAQLGRLSEDLRTSTSLLSEFPTIPSSQLLSIQFHGMGPTHQVLMMLAVRRPGGDAELHEKFDALRLWTFLQAVRVHFQLGVRDRRIDDAASDLRMAADLGNWRLDQIANLRVSARSEESIAQTLRRTGVWSSARLEPKHADLWRRFSKIAQEDRAPYTLPTPFDPSGEGPAPTKVSKPQERENDFGLNDFIEIDGDRPTRNELLDSFTSPITTDSNPSKRAQTGRGILLRNATQLQYLPWSAHKPNPQELARLLEGVAEWDRSEQGDLVALAWVVRIGILTSRSMRLASEIEVSDAPALDFRLSTDGRFLHRQSPRRSVRWHSSEKDCDWIQPVAPLLTIELPTPPEAFRHWIPDAAKVADVWKHFSADSAETVFNTQCDRTEGLQRLSSSHIAEVLSQTIFDLTHDGVLAQMLSSRAKTGISGNGAYASWSGNQVSKGLGWIAQLGAAASAMPGNAAGSELDPLDRALKAQVHHARRHLEQLATAADWIAFHNDFTVYVVTALLAATGARPINDPFESPKHFDFVASRLFLSDKTSVLGMGRLIPLPKSVLELVTQCYCPYLERLAIALGPAAGPMANEIALLAKGKESRHLPYFFLLRTQPCLSWSSVTEHALESSEVFGWPLPANLMRHRLSIRLRQMHCDAELIDALLGHADHGVLSHGDESPRCWIDDMAVISEAMDDSFSALEFATRLPTPDRYPTENLRIDTEQLLPKNKLFGEQARHETRKDDRLRSLEGARKLLRNALKGRKPEEIPSEEWDALAIELLTLDGKRPHPMGGIRYELLRRWQTKLIRQRTMQIKRIFVIDQTPTQSFNRHCIHAQKNMGELVLWFDKAIATLPPSKTSVRLKVALAALDLLVNCRVTAMPVLRDVLGARNVRLVRFEGHHYLEHHSQLDAFATAPVTRYRITQRIAGWLSIAIQSKNSINAWDTVMPEDWWKGFPQRMSERQPSSIGGLIQHIENTVQQANHIDRPGIIAGYLAGRVACSALPHRDLLLRKKRVLKNSDYLTTFHGQVSNTTAMVVPQEDLFDVDTPLPRTRSDAGGLQPHAAQTLVAAFHRILSEYRAAPLAGAVSSTNSTKATRKAEKLHSAAPTSDMELASRRDLVNALRHEMGIHENSVSTAIWCLCAWVVSLTGQPRKKNNPYALSSVQRYLSALGQRFVEVGYDFDLVGSDSDEITEFYNEVLELDRDLDLHYVLDRLQHLHRFAQRHFLADTVYWEELECGTPLPSGSPGILWVEQYLSALEYLYRDTTRGKHERLANAYLLLLSFRFGLRGNDSIGLQLRDLWRFRRLFVVHVQPNQLRPLKRRKSGRRTVPLLEDLTDLEKSIDSEFWQFAQTLGKGHPKAPLFIKDSSYACFDLARLRRRVNEILKAVCSSDDISMHKARHSYADRICTYVMGSHLVSREARLEDHYALAVKHPARQLLLGVETPTRRAPWALAGVLGHARPSTSYKSYVHSLPMWADTWTEERIQFIDRQAVWVNNPLAILDLDALDHERWKKTKPLPQSQETDAPWSAETIFTYLDLIRSGASHKAARTVTRIPEKLAEYLDHDIATVSDILRTRAKRQHGREMGTVLQQISDKEWTALIDRGSQADGKNSCFAPAATTLAISQVSPNRQILLWEEAHFAEAQQFIDLFGLDANCIRFDDGKAAHPTLQAWITRTNLGLLRSPDRTTPLDLAFSGNPPEPRHHRAGLLVNPDPERAPWSGYGLSAIWCIFIGLRRAPK